MTTTDPTDRLAERLRYLMGGAATATALVDLAQATTIPEVAEVITTLGREELEAATLALCLTQAAGVTLAPEVASG